MWKPHFFFLISAVSVSVLGYKRAGCVFLCGC